MLEVICNAENCRSHFPVSDQHFRHHMLSRSGDCPACDSTKTTPLRATPDDAKLALGIVTLTPGADMILNDADINPLLLRHQQGDWGSVDEEDAQVNEQALGKESEPELRQRILAVHKFPKGSIWIITEAGRHATTLLTPGEY